MHAIQSCCKFGMLLTLALPLFFCAAGCEEDDSEGDGEAAGMMAVDVSVSIAPDEDAGSGDLAAEDSAALEEALLNEQPGAADE